MANKEEVVNQLIGEGYSKEDAGELMRLATKLSKAQDEKDKEERDLLDKKKINNLIKAQVEKATAGLEKKKDNTKKKFEYGEVEENKEFEGLKSDIWLLGHITKKRPEEMNPEAIQSGYRNSEHRKVKLDAIKKALDTTDHGSIVPTELQESFIEDIESSSVILDNLRVITLPTNPYEMPYQSGNVTAYGVDENTADTGDNVKASDTGVSNITFNAQKIGARTLWSKELDEDAAIAILPMIREDFQRVTRESWERAFIFGDESTTGNINTHDDDTGITTTAGQKSYWLQADGLVHHCIVDNTGQSIDLDSGNNGYTLAQIDSNHGDPFLSVRELMGKYGRQPGDIIYIVNEATLYQAMDMDAFKTIDKLGTSATIITGMLGAVNGSPLMVSDGLPATDDNGKISGTAANNNQGSMLAINRRVGAIIGRKGEMRIGTAEILDTDQYKGVVFSRYDIQYPWTKAIAYGYDIDQS